jgi:WD40 repeat protein
MLRNLLDLESDTQRTFFDARTRMIIMKIKPVFLIWCLGILASSVWAQGPRLETQTGHRKAIKSVAFNPQGNILATGSEDGTVKLWDVASAREIETLSSGYGAVESIAFSPDGDTLAICSEDSHGVFLMNIVNGKRRILKGSVSEIAYAPDGRLLAGASNRTIYLWDTTMERKIRQLDGHEESIKSLSFAGSGTQLASASKDGVIKIWDTATGNNIRTLGGFSGDVFAATLSKDGKFIAAGDMVGEVKLWNAATGRKLHSINIVENGISEGVLSLAFSPDCKTIAAGTSHGIVRFWDVATGHERLPREDRQQDTTPPLPLQLSLTFAWSIAYSPDGKTVACANSESWPQLWDVMEACPRRWLTTQGGAIKEINSISFSSDGFHLVSANGDKSHSVRIWNLRDGKMEDALDSPDENALSVNCSRNGNFLAVAHYDSVELWDMDKHVLLWKHALDKYPVGKNGDFTWYHFYNVAISPDNKVLAAVMCDATSDHTAYIKFFSIESGLEVQSIEAASDFTGQVIFSPDSKEVALATPNAPVTLWSVGTGQQIFSLKDPTSLDSSAYSVAFSSDGRLVAAGLYEHVTVWDAKSGQVVRVMKEDSDDPTVQSSIGMIYSVVFSPKDDLIAAGGGTGRVQLWDVPSGDKVHTLLGHNSSVNALSFRLDGKWLASAGDDATVRLWSVSDGKQLVSLITPDGESWTVIAPSGRFDTNNLEANQLVSWIMPDDPFKPLPLEIFMQPYYEPRLLPRILAGEKFKPLPALTDLNRVQPRVVINAPQIEPDAPGEVSVSVTVERGTGEYLQGDKKMIKTSGEGMNGARTSGVHDLRLFRDGQRVGDNPQADGEIKLEADGRQTITFHHIQLPRVADKKSVEFSAYAFNVDRVKSETARREYILPALTPQKGKAYVITFGVNASRNPDLHLAFAVNDAKLMRDVLAQTLRQRNETTHEYSDVAAVSLLSDTDEKGNLTIADATKENFAAVLHLLAGEPVDAVRLEALKIHNPDIVKIEKATPQDLIMIAFSCHGDSDDDGEFYLLPYDVDVQIPAFGKPWRHAISSEDLSRWLRNVDAGDMVMIVDACHAAAAVGNEFKPGPMGSRGLGQLAYDKGMRILAASQADNVALESGKIGHGLLTYALLDEGIKAEEANDNPKDAQLLLDEWLGYGVERVPLLSQEIKSQTFVAQAKGVRILYTPQISVQPSAQQALGQQPSLFDFKKQRRPVVLEETH